MAKNKQGVLRHIRKFFENEDWINGFSVFCVGKIDDEKNFYPSKESIKVIKSWYE